MCHINALLKRQLQHLVSECNGLVNDMHRDFACVVGEFFKFEELKLNTKGRILHFKRPDDSLTGNKVMEYTLSLKHNVSLTIFFLKLPATMLSIFEFNR